MNVVHRVTLATLKKNRRRTIVTILGTAVAVAMVTAIAVICSSFSEMGRQAAEVSYGSWHVEYRGLDILGAEYLQNADEVEYVDLDMGQGFVWLPGQEGRTRQSMFVSAYNAAAFKHLPLQIVEGHLPEKPGEILLSSNFQSATGLEWPVGSTVTLDNGYFLLTHTNADGVEEQIQLHNKNSALQNASFVAVQSVTYTITGYADIGRLDNGYSAHYTAVTVFEPATLLPGEYTLTALVGAQKASSDLVDRFEAVTNGLVQMYAENGVEYAPFVSYNDALLAFSGAFVNEYLFETFGVFIAILLLIVVLGSVSLVSNAFTISLTERVRALGMLAGVGATKRQKRASVFFEALVIGALAIPLGILFGIVGIGVTLYLLGDALGEMLFGFVAPLRLSVSLWAVLFTVVFSIGMLLLSAWMPARKASRISPVDAMRAGDKNERVRASRSSPLLRRIFGFEAELGVKNSKRNRRRYFAILSSLVISVVLFVTVYSAMQYIRQSARLVTNAGDLTVETHLTWANDIEEQQLYEISRSLRELAGEGASNLMMETRDVRVDVPFEQIDPTVLSLMQQAGWNLEGTQAYPDGAVEFSVPIRAVMDEDFDVYCEQLGLDASQFGNGTDGFDVILLRTINGRSPVTNGWGRYQTTTWDAGDSIQVPSGWYPDGYENGPLMLSLNIVGVAEQPWEMFDQNFYNITYQPVIMRWSQYQAFAGELFDQNETRWMLFYTDTQNASEFAQAVDVADYGGIYAYCYNVQENVQRNRMIILVFEVFTYGFVVLISLVCAANIFNTVSTGIALRTREFAMLRSAGLTPKGFRRMMDCETLFYGVKALLWGVPVGLGLSWLLYNVLQNAISLSASFFVPWECYAIVVAGVFLLVGSSMLYARRKVATLNIAETLKNENW